MSKLFKSLMVLMVVALVLAACAPAAAPAPAAPAAEKPAAEAPAAEKPAAAAPAAGKVVVGLITKTETNPFFVKMKEGAQAEAEAKGATLMTAAGAFDGDNEGQVTAIENMVNAGAKGILITPNDAKAIIPAIKKAQDAGVMVIALDSPLQPKDASDALFATNNFVAGELIGKYAAAAMKGKTPKIVALDAAVGNPVAVLRHNGFMTGFGLAKLDDTATDYVNTPEIVCAGDSNGDQAKGQTVMENCLSKNPEVNIVYTINEPAAAGAYTALKAAGKEKDVLIVSIDGGCPGVENVMAGKIAATSQQYPLLMASMGVEATVEYATSGKKASGYTDTGVSLITDKPMEGVESKDTKYGYEKCWGVKTEGAAAPAAEAPAAEAPAAPAGEVVVGLITKTETNPFFVKMKEGAQAEADAKGAKLMTAAGAFDGDNEGQVTAIENMVNAGAKGILITPNDAKAIIPAIKKAQDAGVMVIALDSPLQPKDASDALFATNNFVAGELIGKYAAAAMKGKTPKIVALDAAVGNPVAVLRHNGFMTGFGLAKLDDTATDYVNTPEIVCAGDSNGDQAKGQTVMENCLSKNPEVNIVYTINEPAAAGAYTALKAAGKEKDVLIVSIDGGCPGVENVMAGKIAATSQQYPLLMASMGVDATVEYATSGKKVSGYTDTGVSLITDKPMEGVESKDTKFGYEKCWGVKSK